jgi:DNA-binding beta-propeller fold protein YncE
VPGRFSTGELGVTITTSTNSPPTLVGLVLVGLAAGCGTDTGPAMLPSRIVSRSMPAAGPMIPAPRAVTTAADNTVYVLDNAGRVLVFDREGRPLRQWDMPESDVGNPEGVCLLSDGRIAVADTHYHRVVIFDDQGRVEKMFGQEGQRNGEFIWPVAIVEDGEGNLFVSEYGGANRVQKFDRNWRHLLTFGGLGDAPGQFQRPSGMVWRNGRLYIVDAFNDRIQVFDAHGHFLEILGTQDKSSRLHYPYDIALGPDGDLWVVEYGAGRVSRFDLSGRLLGRFGTTGSGRNQFGTPWGLGVDSTRRVWVADTRNRRLVSLDL